MSSSAKTTPFLFLLPGVFILALLWEMGAHSDQWIALTHQFLPQVRGVFCALLLAGLALLVGHGTLRLCRFSNETPWALSLALGWGLLSLFTCLLAAAGTASGFSLFFKGTPWLFLLVAGVLFRGALHELVVTGKTILRQHLKNIREGLQATPPWALSGVALLLPVVALTLLRLGLTALAPSFQYDVLEYHLPAVRQMLDTGTFAPVPGVRYTLMPQAVEALYAFGSLLEGGAEPLAPKLLHLLLALSAAGVLNLLLREFQVAAALRLLGVCLFLLHPVAFKSLSDAFVEMGPALFVTAALVAWLRSGADAKYRLLAGAFLGLAFSCKYTVAGVAIVPFFLLLIPEGSAKKTVKNGLLTAGVAGIVYLPWLFRGVVFGHSVFPPLTLPLHADALELSLARCMAAYHQPSFAEWAHQAVSRIPDVGTLLFLPAVALLAIPLLDKRVKRLALFAVAGYLVWCTAHNPEDRFLSALLPLFAALAILLVHAAGRFRPLCVGALGVWLGLLFITQGLGAHMQGFLQAGLGVLPQRAFQEKLWGKPVVEFFDAMETAADKQKSPRVLLLFEARAAALPAWLPVEFNTVFDSGPFWQLLQEPQADDPQWVVEQLRKRGITLLAVNEAEQARLLATYPALESRADKAYQAVRLAANTGRSFDPAYLTQTRFYPAIYYAPCGADVMIKRLESFLQHTRTACPVVWQTDLGGAKMWVSQIR